MNIVILHGRITYFTIYPNKNIFFYYLYKYIFFNTYILVKSNLSIERISGLSFKIIYVCIMLMELFHYLYIYQMKNILICTHFFIMIFIVFNKFDKKKIFVHLFIWFFIRQNIQFLKSMRMYLLTIILFKYWCSKIIVMTNIKKKLVKVNTFKLWGSIFYSYKTFVGNQISTISYKKWDTYQLN